jgi:hypothetical protein
MKNKIWDDLPKSVKLNTGKWVQIHLDKGEGYLLYDPIDEIELGKILFDEADHWIYDGELLSVREQEELAGSISGHQKEMDELVKSLKTDQRF